VAYFLVIPAFILWLLVATIAVVITKYITKLSAAYPYVLRIAIGSIIGILIANALLIGLLALGFVGADSLNRGASRDTAQIVWGLATFVGPIMASVAGWILGGIVGVGHALLPFLVRKSKVASTQD
jgi:Ca2+/Na+ antiporter